MESSQRVSVRFEHVAIQGEVLYCNQKSGGYVTCIGVKPENDAHRREPRFPVYQPASISLLGDRGTFGLKGSVPDISKSGLGLKVSQPADVGCMICVETESMIVAGEVRHCRKSSEDGQFRMGLQITDILMDSGERRGWFGRIEEPRWRLAEVIVGRPLRIRRRVT